MRMSLKKNRSTWNLNFKLKHPLNLSFGVLVSSLLVVAHFVFLPIRGAFGTRLSSKWLHLTLLLLLLIFFPQRSTLVDFQLDFQCASAEMVKISLNVVVDNSSTLMLWMVL